MSATEKVISLEEVTLAYKYILGRSPNSLEDLSGMQSLGDYRTLRKELMSRPEFVSRVRPLLLKDSSEHPINFINRRAVIYIHLQKAAGTTVTDLLERQFRPDTCCPERFNHLHLYTAAELSKYDVFSGHYDLFSTNFIPRTNKFIFCIFREPVDRLISFYRFVRAHPKAPEHLLDPLFELSERLNIEEYFSHPAVRRSRQVNNHYRAVLSGSLDPADREDAIYSGTLDAAIEAVNKLDGVGLTERLSESVKLIFDAAGLQSELQIGATMMSEHMHKIDDEVRYVAPIVKTTQLMNILRPLVQDDSSIYRHVKQTVEQRLANI